MFEGRRRLDAYTIRSLSWRLRPDAEKFAAPLLGDQSIFSFSFSFPFWLGEPDAAIRELDAGRFQDGADGGNVVYQPYSLTGSCFHSY